MALALGGETAAECLRDWPPTELNLAAGWVPLFNAFVASPAGQQLRQFLRARLQAGAVIYPPEPLRALQLTSLEQVRVVILGQDPYHGPGQGEGLAFSVGAGAKIPPSLRNIFKELQSEGLLVAPPQQGSLRAWAAQGVLLLNTCLTVEQGRPASHAGQGWEVFTDSLLTAIVQKAPCAAYLLWGTHAQSKAPLITEAAAQAHRPALILKANHPSPLSARRPPQPFLGCGHFVLAQQWLAQLGVVLDWHL